MVLALAGGAFVADRALMGGPKSASADTIPDTLTIPASERKVAPVSMNSTDTAAARLAGFATTVALPKGNLDVVPVWLAVKQEQAVKPASESEKLWAKRHRVSGYSRQTAGVSVDGEFVKVGEIFDGMMLMSIALDTGEAVFANASGVEARLPLPGLWRDGVSENRGVKTPIGK
jgi:hypothetical protein